MASNLERALAYLEKMDPAVSGGGGHNQTLRAACECFRFGLSSGEAWEALEWFNQYRCVPPWKEHELRHKLVDAERMVAKAGQAARHVGARTFRPHARRVWTAPPAPTVKALPAKSVPIYQRDEADEEAWWAGVAAARGFASLDEFDQFCGNTPVREPEPVEEVFQHG